MLSKAPSRAGLSETAGRQSVPAAVTDVGCEREINEDRYAVIDGPSGRAWIVCDGMGGALGGELAAQLAIDAVRRRLEGPNRGEPAIALGEAIEEANRIIVLRRQNPAFSAMGTTVVAALVCGNEVAISHAGDSRAYLVRGDQIQQLTVDHTYVQDLVERGAIREEEALSHPQAHVLTRCLGAEPRLELDVLQYWIWDAVAGEPNDMLLLCSDGLYSLIPDEEIAEIVSRYSPQESCVRLVEMAKDRGGYDNITITILPLGGQLRDERPEGARPANVEQKKVSQPNRPQSRLSPIKRIVLMMALAALGGLVTLLAFFGLFVAK